MRTLRVKHAVTRLKNKIIGQSRIATQLQGPEQASLAKDFGTSIFNCIIIIANISVNILFVERIILWTNIWIQAHFLRRKHLS